MSDHYNPGSQDDGDEPATPGSESDEPHEGNPPRDPFDENDDEWRDEAYGRISDARRLVAQGLLQINLDQDLAAITELKDKALKLALEQFEYAIQLGDPSFGDKQIKNGVLLSGCFRSLLKAQDDLLGGIGRRR